MIADRGIELFRRTAAEIAAEMLTAAEVPRLWPENIPQPLTSRDSEHPESDVLAAIDALERDEIDDLVDLQLQQTRSGYDFNVNQPTCWRCGEDFHELPIRQRMREIRQLWHSTITYYEHDQDRPHVPDATLKALNNYRYDEDDSPILCPGSDVQGPTPASPGLWTLPGDPFDAGSWMDATQRAADALQQFQYAYTAMFNGWRELMDAASWLATTLRNES